MWWVEKLQILTINPNQKINTENNSKSIYANDKKYVSE